MRPHVRHRTADIAVMLAVVSMSVVTWACLCDGAGVPPGIAIWKSYLSVGTAVVFGLAALTRHPGWAAAARGFMGAWMAVVPYLLGVADPARLVYLVIGLALMMTVVPRYVRIGKAVFAPDVSAGDWLAAER